jgi:hypothetical protein
MLFKDGAIQQEAFLKYKSPDEDNMRAHKILVGVLHILDAVSNEVLDDGEITITSAVRPPRNGKPSFHPIGQGADIHSKTKSHEWLEAMTTTIINLKSIDPQIGFLLEEHGLPNEHIHLQVRTGKPI